MTQIIKIAKKKTKKLFIEEHITFPIIKHIQVLTFTSM